MNMDNARKAQKNPKIYFQVKVKKASFMPPKLTVIMLPPRTFSLQEFSTFRLFHLCRLYYIKNKSNIKLDITDNT